MSLPFHGSVAVLVAVGAPPADDPWMGIHVYATWGRHRDVRAAVSSTAVHRKADAVTTVRNSPCYGTPGLLHATSMAQLASSSPTPRALASTSPNPTGSGSFTPRKEFLTQQRVISTFSLLALSSANLVRLYNFPSSVISALRRVFDHQDLIISVREDNRKDFLEFCLDRRPWASPKSVETEELFIAMLTAILQCGYSFLSTIDYGREPDDRLAIAFSRPDSVLPPGVPASVSAVTLAQPLRALFAVSFVSTNILRVVNPPLQTTPAILASVRSAWPRGVVSEKKFGDATYQFKLKGYKIFQENTLAVDSLQQILSLLGTLDKNAFTLLTSVTMSSRSRKQDLWIFTGPPADLPTHDSPQSSPGTLSVELRGDNAVYGGQTSIEKLAPIASSYRVGNSAPTTSSPLKPSTLLAHKAPGKMLRKASPKVNIPLAYLSDDSATNSPVDNKQHPFSSSMGSVDMTGVGTSRGKGGERLSQSPDVLLMTAGIPPYAHAQNYLYGTNPWQNMPLTHPATSPNYLAGRASTGFATSPTPENVPASHSSGPSYDLPSSQPQPSPSSQQVLEQGNDDDAASPAPPSQVEGQSPLTRPDSQDYFGNAQLLEQGQSMFKDVPIITLDIPRTPTPPLLTAGVFRDSAFSSTTAYTGRDFEPQRGTLAEIKEEEDEGNREREHLQEYFQRKPREHAPIGPMFPGAWGPTPKDERRYDDVVPNMLPPTIQERPSQELDELAHASRNDRAHARPTPSPIYAAHVPSRMGEVGSEADSSRSRGNEAGSMTASSNNAPSSTRSGTLGTLASSKRPGPTRRDTDDSGWVVVNINAGPRGDQDNKGKTRHAQSASPDPARRTRLPTSPPSTNSRPSAHTRSSSDSRVPRSQGTTKDAGAMSSMHPAAKAIVIIDAVGAKEKEHEKSQSGSGFKRLFQRGRDKGQSAQATQAPARPSDPSRRLNRPQGGGVTTKRPAQEGADRTTERRKSPPATTRR